MCALHKTWRIIKSNKERNKQEWGEVSNTEISAAYLEESMAAAQAPGFMEILQIAVFVQKLREDSALWGSLVVNK